MFTAQMARDSRLSELNLDQVLAQIEMDAPYSGKTWFTANRVPQEVRENLEYLGYRLENEGNRLMIYWN